MCTFPQLTFQVAGNQLTLSSLSAGREGGCVTSGSGSGRLYWDIQLRGLRLVERGWVRKHAGATPRKPLPLCFEHFFVSTVLDTDITSHTSGRHDIRKRIVREQASPGQAPCRHKHLLHILCRYDVLIGWGKSDDPHRELVSWRPCLVCPTQCGPSNKKPQMNIINAIVTTVPVYSIMQWYVREDRMPNLKGQFTQLTSVAVAVVMIMS